MMGIMMPETCSDKSLIINIRLVASCRFLSLHPTFMMHGHKSLKHPTCVLIFSVTSVSDISHSNKNWAIYDQKIYIIIHIKYPLFLSGFNGLEFFGENFEKSSNIKFIKNPSIWSRVGP